MKIGVPSNRPDLDGTISHKLGAAPYLLVIETDDMSFEVGKGMADAAGPGAGVQALTLMVDMGAQTILVDSISPHIAASLERQSIAVVTGLSGSVADAVSEYAATAGSGRNTIPAASHAEQSDQWRDALKRGVRQLYSLVPRLVGVILLLGLFRGFVSEKELLSLFAGSPWYDAFVGASLGSVLVGNPVNSYVIGESLLRSGVGVAGAAALMLAWVSVGLIQFPAESAAVGMRFALARNVAAYCVAMVMALVMTFLHGGIL